MPKKPHKLLKESKYLDEEFWLSRKKGGGIIRREIWVDQSGRVTRYNLAYINHAIFNKDNGRIVGYDNAHGYHHKHFYGEVLPIRFKSFEQTEVAFEKDVMSLLAQNKSFTKKMSH